MISKKLFGNTKHNSTKTIFGAAALWSVTQDQANKVLEILLEYGINHIDTAASYGESELRLGPWMSEHRKNFFLATKTEKRTYKEAKEELYRSLDRLKVDYIDLWQMHNLINLEQKEQALSPDGAIDAFIEAREEGLTRFIGITGHGLSAPRRHKDSLQKIKFDSVLLPYNYIMMQDEKYASEFNELEKYCIDNRIAIQTIKSLAQGELKKEDSKYSVWYTPLENEASINNAVHWVLGNNNVFLNTTGDITLLPVVLKAANNFNSRPDKVTMNYDVTKYGIFSLFKGEEI